MTYPAYSEYKDSEIEWLKSIPEHWEIKKLKYLGRSFIGLTYSPDDVVDEGQGILVLRSSNVQNKKITFDSNVYVNKIIPEKLKTVAGDILICSRNGSRDLIGKNAVIGYGSEGLTFGAFMTIFRSQHNSYLSFVFNSTLFEFQSSSFLTSTINQLTVGNLNGFKIPLPPKVERKQIASFLYRETQKIDRLIEKQEQLIKLLQEKRQAVISHAVTKGLNPNVKMKDSGVEWLGEIPEHWEVKKLKYLISKLESGVSVNATDIPAEEDEIGVLKTSCVYTRKFRSKENKAVFEEEYNRVKCPVRKDAIIISRMNTPDLVGASALVESDLGNLYLPDRLWQTVFFNDAVQSSKFISYFMMIEGFRDEISNYAEGASSSMQNIAKEDYLSIHVLLPAIEEQEDLVSHIDMNLKKLLLLIGKSEHAVELLKERRTALISAAVTGKIDVRNDEDNSQLDTLIIEPGKVTG